MLTQHELILRNTSGDGIARFDDWIRFEVRHAVNDFSRASLQLNGNDDRVLLFGLDYILEDWRSIREANVEQYLEAELFHRSFAYEQPNVTYYTSRLVGYEHLLSRRVILNYVGLDRAKKADVAETVLKEYVDEQAGPNATVALGRLFTDGTIAGLTIQADAATGDNWEGDSSFRNLLEVLQEIAEARDMAFSVVGLDNSVPSFQFRAWPKPYGADRTHTGMDAATGRNAAGNYPVIFSPDEGTAIAPSYGINREAEGNVAISMGRGSEGERILREVELPGTDYKTDSPWNRCEVAIQGVQQTTAAALDDAGYAKLEATKPLPWVELEVVQHPSCLYGRDYFLGDIVTCRVSGIEINRTIVAVTLTVEGKANEFTESVAVELGE